MTHKTSGKPGMKDGMRQPEEHWNEFDWERALRESDEYARRYLHLLKRFCDLPGSDELIARHMGPDFDPELLDYDTGNPEDWEDEPPTDNWHPGNENRDEDADGDDDADGDRNDDSDSPRPGESLFYETDPLFVALRQAATGWCNVYAAILPQEARAAGLVVLFHIGRALANLAYSIDDGLFEQPAASVSFAKRSLDNLNKAIGGINRLMTECPRLDQILQTVRDHLVQGAESLTDHIQRCRERLTDGEEKQE